MTFINLNLPGVGSPRQTVEKRREKLATNLARTGYQFRPLLEVHWPVVNELVKKYLDVAPDWEITSDSIGLAVTSADGQLAAFVIVQIMSVEGKTVVFVTHLVTEPQHRGSGLAQVMLGMLDQVAVNHGAELPAVTLGFCSDEGVRLYRRSGFEVGERGGVAEFPPGLDLPAMASSRDSYQFPFVRYW